MKPLSDKAAEFLSKVVAAADDGGCDPATCHGQTLNSLWSRNLIRCIGDRVYPTDQAEKALASWLERKTRRGGGDD